MIQEKTMEQLAREEIVRQTLEAAARAVETENVNAIYQRAFRRAAKIIRALSPR